MALRVDREAARPLPPDGRLEPDGSFITGSGQHLVTVHVRTADCLEHGCVVHAPTDHNMRGFRTFWRDDRGLIERICPHGVGHPDPDNLSFFKRVLPPERAAGEGVHGCDGCCGVLD